MQDTPWFQRDHTQDPVGPVRLDFHGREPAAAAGAGNDGGAEAGQAAGVLA